jgi:Cdc6-like AAA superfamily ATPase
MQSDRQAYVEFMGRCQQAFRPFAPIDLPEFFKGRQERVELLVSELRTPGRQVAIYGERGVGKTSLAMLAYFFAGFNDEETYFVRCEGQSTYETIFGQFLEQAGAAYLPNGIETETSAGAGLRTGPLSLLGGRKTRLRQQPVDSARSVGPSVLLGRFQEREGLLILDEYDRVRDESTHTRLAETLKHFSDANSSTKIIVVGVAETLDQLMGEHQSLTRCLAQIKLDRMTSEELGEIIQTGEERAGMAFQETVRRKIIALSDGFPFYTHLLSKYAAEEAGKVLLRNSAAKVVVTETEYRKAIRRAIETAESALRENYQKAVVTVKRKTEMFKYVLWAVGYSEHIEVQVKDIARNIGLLTGETPKVESLSTYLGPLTRPEKGQVLLRVRQGYYKYANPLMRAYIRLILEDQNIDTHGQRVFPWMQQV